jgi:hypothetical protein
VSEQKLLFLRRDGVCSQCGCALPAGIRAYWLRPEHVVLCTRCVDPSGTGGSGAARDYERRQETQIEQKQGRYGTIGLLAARISRAPARGNEWEDAEHIARLLTDKPVKVLHNRNLPGQRMSIEHIAVGPGGVTVIDSRRPRGKAKVAERLTVGGARRPQLVTALQRQVELVRIVLTEERLAHVPVTGALCVAGVREVPLATRQRVGEVVIDSARAIARLIVDGGGLDAHAIDEVAAVLEWRLPAA